MILLSSYKSLTSNSTFWQEASYTKFITYDFGTFDLRTRGHILQDTRLLLCYMPRLQSTHRKTSYTHCQRYRPDILWGNTKYLIIVDITDTFSLFWLLFNYIVLRLGLQW